MDFENQEMLETFFNARQTPLLLRQEIMGSDAVLTKIGATDLPQEFALDLIAQMMLAKRATVPTLVGLLRHHFKTEPDPFQACADALLKAAEADLVNFDTDTEKFVLEFDCDQKTHDLIRQYQYMPPMIVPPLKVTSNRGSGYITIRTDSLLLKDNHHDGDICLDSINRFNAIPLTINIDVVKGIRNAWKNLDKQKDGETYQDYRKRVDAFERYERNSFFTIALLENVGNRFHLTHKPDKRGRTYAQGYHVNPQGNCWNKAVLEFAEKEVVNG